MSQYYCITIKAHVANSSEKGKVFIQKIKTEVEELQKMKVEPDFRCDDDNRGFTDIMLCFEDSSSGMIDLTDFFHSVFFIEETFHSYFHASIIPCFDDSFNGFLEVTSIY